MSRNGIGYAAVEAAAQQLQAAGKNPTIDRVREILKTGSKSTIAKHLKVWQQQPALEDPHLPPQELTSMMTGIWAALQEKTSQQLTQMRQEYEEKMQVLFNEKWQDQQQIETLQNTVNQFEKALSEQKLLSQELNETLLREQEEKRLSSLQVQSLENALLDQKAENEKLYRLFHQVQKNLEHYQTAMQCLQQEQAMAMDNQRGQYELALNDLRQKLSETWIQKNLLQNRFEQACDQLENNVKQVSNLEALLKEKEMGEIAVRERYEILAEQHAKNLKVLQDKTHALMSIQEKNAIDTHQLSVLHQNLTAVEQKLQLLKQQYSTIVQEKAKLEGKLESYALQVRS